MSITVGYYKKKDPEQPFIMDERSGEKYLLTGDVGDMSQDGYLVIKDRKKDIIITSYGKNIQPFHIESKLKDIQGITEAMLAGEGKPYCSAFVWLQGGNSQNYVFLDRNILQVNSGLAGPEKIKRWVFIKYNLSIEDGLLTPNLKLKRTGILDRNKGLMDILYVVSETKDFRILNALLSGNEKSSSNKNINILFETAAKHGALHFGYSDSGYSDENSKEGGVS